MKTFHLLCFLVFTISSTQLEANYVVNRSSATQEVYSTEPLILSNPVCRILGSFVKSIHSLCRVDRIVRPQQKYFSNVLDDLTELTADTLGVVGHTANDVSRLASHLSADENYISSKNVLQCTSVLPFTLIQGGAITGALSQARHGWLQVFNDTYGMPFTKKGNYLGGEAVIETPDPFVDKRTKMRGVVCTPIQHHVDIDPLDFDRNLSCLAKKLSYNSEILNSERWFPVLDYHALKNNCIAATDLIVSCAGGKQTQFPNFGIGDHLDSDRDIKIEEHLDLHDVDKKYLSIKNTEETKVFVLIEQLRKNAGANFKSSQFKWQINKFGRAMAIYFQVLHDSQIQIKDSWRFKSIYNLMQHTLSKSIVKNNDILEIVNFLDSAFDSVSYYVVTTRKMTWDEICHKAKLECDVL